jgi:Arc/MetJ-type ribon-helix-helix transcriptional regulator
MRIFSVYIDKKELEFIDLYVASSDSSYVSRAEFMRAAIHEKIQTEVEQRYKLQRVTDTLKLELGVPL